MKLISMTVTDIVRNEFIKKEAEFLKPLNRNCEHENYTHVGEIDEWYCRDCFSLIYWDKETKKYK